MFQVGKHDDTNCCGLKGKINDKWKTEEARKEGGSSEEVNLKDEGKDKNPLSVEQRTR